MSSWLFLTFAEKLNNNLTFRNNIKVSDPAYRKFWMGRSFGTDEHYLTRDPEEHRQECAQAYNNLRILREEKSEALSQLQQRYDEMFKKYQSLEANSKRKDVEIERLKNERITLAEEIADVRRKVDLLLKERTMETY